MRDAALTWRIGFLTVLLLLVFAQAAGGVRSETLRCALFRIVHASTGRRGGPTGKILTQTRRKGGTNEVKGGPEKGG